MNIAIIASTGKLGRMLFQKLEGKASLTAIVRNASRLPEGQSSEVIEKDFLPLQRVM